MAEKKSKINLKRIVRIIFFPLLFFALLFLYESPISCFNDSYGLSAGTVDKIIIKNFWDILDFIFIKAVHILYMFFGEKESVIIGFQIITRLLNGILIYFLFKNIRKEKIGFIAAFLYTLIPFLVNEMYTYDGMLILELICVFILFMIEVLIMLITRSKKQAQISYKIDDTQNESVSQSKDKTEFIPNPLPVPKKHVRKEMDFDLKIDDVMMHYDIPEPENDYFDIE